LLQVDNKIKKISKNFKSEKKHNILIDKLDNYKKIFHINFLKIDTQGYDLEVLKGSKNFLKKKKIDIILTEYIVSKCYKNSCKASELFKFMETYGYNLHSILTTNYTNRNYLYYCDLCFLSPSLWRKLGYL
jgi:hypothetical protein